MNAISKRIEHDIDLTFFRVEGKVTANELVETIRDFYETSITSNVMWDLTRSELSLISPQDVQRIAALSAEYATSRPAGKTAIIGADDLTFGLARMYELNKESADLPFETRTFRNIDDAYDWIRGH